MSKGDIFSHNLVLKNIYLFFNGFLFSEFEDIFFCIGLFCLLETRNYPTTQIHLKKPFFPEGQIKPLPKDKALRKACTAHYYRDFWTNVVTKIDWHHLYKIQIKAS